MGSKKQGNQGQKYFAAYLRVSTTDQKEALGGQEEAIKQWVRNNGIPMDRVKFYIDQETGNYLKGRKGFDQLEKDIFDGLISTVIVYEISRLGRNIREGVFVLYSWLDKGIRVVSITQQFDFSGTIGQIIANLLMGIAQIETEQRKQRQRIGIDKAMRKGRYKRCGRKAGSFKGNPNRAWRLRERGFTIKEIAKSMGVSEQSIYVYFRHLRSKGKVLHMEPKPAW